MHTMRLTGLGAAALAASLLLPGAARAQVGALVTPAVTSLGNGQSTYSYTLKDTGTSALGEFTLTIPTDVTLVNETAPAGWVITYTPASNVIDWSSTDPSTDIVPGKSVLGFGFDGPFSSGPASYQVTSFDDFTTDSGTTSGPADPAAVPEAPSAISLGLLLMLGMGGTVVARKKAKAPAA